MSTSTDGQICYGVVFEEDYEFPWDEEYGGDIEEWWLYESGWRWNGEEPFTPEGYFAHGFNDGDPRLDAYWDSRSEWQKDHPLPIILVNYQSSEVPAYILACPSTTRTANRGYPVRFNPLELVVSEDEKMSLLDFCRRYELTPNLEAGWYLTSYWG